ncbi:amino acid permease [Acinetobacter pittii]|nr:amino acid permease [Acinetobacter pittii]
MSLGAAIGVGLFLGSGAAIKMAGPSILLGYLIGGLAVFIIMRALGEMAVDNPVAGSFSRYACDYISPLAGYLTGWNYWFFWIVTCMAEVTAVGIYMQFWFPDSPAWIWALISLTAMAAVNFIAVKAYGEFEFWFAMIKVVTIILMIISGLGMIVFGFGNNGVATGIGNLWSHGGFFPNGLTGLLVALPLVTFAYGGIEMLGVTAGEAKNPTQSIASAINSVFWRILIFYVGALFVVMSIYPWNEIGTTGSPFVMTFEKIGIPAAAGIINFVVITSALSSCNSGIFSTGRMLNNLSFQGQALKIFKHINLKGVPVYAILFSVFMLLFGVVLNYVAPKQVFMWLIAISTFASMWTWFIILVAHIKFKKNFEYKKVSNICVPFFPITSYLTIAYLFVVAGVMFFKEDLRMALIIGVIWMFFLVALYYILGYNKKNNIAELTKGKI